MKKTIATLALLLALLRPRQLVGKLNFGLRGGAWHIRRRIDTTRKTR